MTADDRAGRVLLVTSNFPRWEGDSVTPFVLHLAVALQEIGWRVDVLAPHAADAARHETIDGVQVDRFRYLLPERQQTVCYGGGALVNLRHDRSNVVKLPALVAAEWMATAQRVRRGGYDLVNAHWILPQGLVATAVPGRTPKVITAHGGDVFGLQGRALTSAKRLALRRADAVTCNSSVTERAIQDIAPGLTLHRIPMGVRASFAADPELTRRLRARLRRGHGPLLAFVGRLVEEKGYADFLAALQQVAERHPDATGVVVGEGQDRAAAERLASDLGVGSRVHFAGWVDAADVPSYLAASDVFLAPSRRASDGWIEAQGLTVIEAMLAGVPVVASTSGGIVDTIEDGVTGLLVPERAPDALAAAVERIVGDPGLRDRLVTEGRRSAAERFSLTATAAAFDDLFRTVIGPRRARLRRTGAA